MTAAKSRTLPRRRDRAFTLVELLAVLAILGLLMGMAIHFFGKHREQGFVTKTTAVFSELEMKIGAYNTKKGDFPPSSLAKLKIRADNELNDGAEALFAALHSKSYPEGDNVRDDLLGNTDDDSTTTAYHRDPAVTYLLEVLDGWGNPIAYFHNADYAREQRYVMADPADPNDPEQKASAQKSKVTGSYANSDTFQLISAGTDRIFGTEDDVTNFK